MSKQPIKLHFQRDDDKMSQKNKPFGLRSKDLKILN